MVEEQVFRDTSEDFVEGFNTFEEGTPSPKPLRVKSLGDNATSVAILIDLMAMPVEELVEKTLGRGARLPVVALLATE